MDHSWGRGKACDKWQIKEVEMPDGWWIPFVGPALALLGTLILTVASLAWRTVIKIEKKMEKIIATETACREELAKEYVRWDVLYPRIVDPLASDRKDRWREFDVHKHDPASGVLLKT